MIRRIRFAFVIDSICACLLDSPIIILTMDCENTFLINLFNLFFTIPLVYCFFMFSPLIFKNASIGMKFMGLMLVDEKFNVPSVKLIMKRWILLPMWALENFKSVFNENTTNEWELKHLGTQLVSAKNKQFH